MVFLGKVFGGVSVLGREGDYKRRGIARGGPRGRDAPLPQARAHPQVGPAPAPGVAPSGSSASEPYSS